MTQDKWVDVKNIRGGLFYGAHGNRFKIGSTVYEVMEDPDDGYRSMLEGVQVAHDAGGFFKAPLDRVRIVEAQPLDECVPMSGWEIQSIADGHTWLTFGTEHYDDYYPCFVFRYTPRVQSVVDLPHSQTGVALEDQLKQAHAATLELAEVLAQPIKPNDIEGVRLLVGGARLAARRLLEGFDALQDEL